MRPDDFNAFSDQAAVLCAGFNVPATAERVEAYWRGLQKMDLMVFTRAVEYALGESGPEKIPTTPQIWNIVRQMRSRANVVQFKREEAPVVDDYVAFANRRMLRYLFRCGAATDQSLLRMIAEKNRLAAAYRSIDSEEKVSEEEFAKELARAWDRVFVERPRCA